jgi:hypothetical protein
MADFIFTPEHTFVAGPHGWSIANARKRKLFQSIFTAGKALNGWRASQHGKRSIDTAIKICRKAPTAVSR